MANSVGENYPRLVSYVALLIAAIVTTLSTDGYGKDRTAPVIDSPA